jgi:uncharacterized membrane protein
MVLALEAVLLTAFVLIRQNWMSLKADQRSHLDLQINLLAEREATKVIQLLQRISKHLGIEETVPMSRHGSWAKTRKLKTSRETFAKILNTIRIANEASRCQEIS